MNRLFLLLIISVFTLISCSRIAPKPIGPNYGGVGISIKLCPLIGFCNSPHYGVFIRLNESGNLISPTKVYISNLVYSDRVYLLNVKPGRYAFVAAYFILSKFQRIDGTPPLPGTGPTYTTYLPKIYVLQTVTEIHPGEIRYMGSYVVNMRRMVGADKVQLQYFKLLEKSGETTLSDLSATIGGLVAMVIDMVEMEKIMEKESTVLTEGAGVWADMVRGFVEKKYSYKGDPEKAERNQKSEDNFWKKALGDLKESEWESRIRRTASD